HSPNECALAGIGQTKQTHIGQHLQLQLEITRFTRFTWRSLPRRTVGTGFEAGIAQPVPAPLGYQQALSRLDQVTDNILSGHIDYRSAYWYRQDQILTLGPGTVAAATLLAVLGKKLAGVAVVDQGVEVFISL